MSAIEYDADGFPVFEKDPDAVKTYEINLGTHPTDPYLSQGEEVQEMAWEVTGGDGALGLGDGIATVDTGVGTVTPSAPVLTLPGQMQATVYGGTVGTTYTLSARFRTNSSPQTVDERSIKITVVER